MQTTPCGTRLVEVALLGERLASLRLCDAAAITSLRESLERHGQLSALVLFVVGDQLEIIDGFKRLRAARALGWATLHARIDDIDVVDAKLRLCELHATRGLTELEEAWLVRSLYRDDHLAQPEIARRMRRHKSWVCRRLMLVESLELAVQADVRLGLLAARAAVALSRLPRGNQHAAGAVVVRRGLTVRQTELLVEEVLSHESQTARAAVLARRLERAVSDAKADVPSRVVRNEADWMSADVAKLCEVAARLEARLLATPLHSFTPAAAELLSAALRRLSPILRALDGIIATVVAGQSAQ
jgi:ParB-like chromosome segregation protein Spo0J